MGGKDSGGSSSTPSVASDTLRSLAYAYVLDAICEGPIYGFPNPQYPEKYIKLNGTPIQDYDDDTYNFDGTKIEFRAGYPQQSHIPGMHTVSSDISTDLGFPAQVKHGDSHRVTVTVTDADADEFLLRFSVPALQETLTTGSVDGSSVEIMVEIKDSTTGSDWVQVYSKTLEGKARSKYEWSTYVNLNDAGCGLTSPWTVRMTRVTEDASSTLISNDTWFEGLTVCQNKKLTYPCVALCAVRADASQFSSTPSRSYHLKGMIIRVPSNYTPASQDYDTKLWTAASYSGTWDGSFKLAYSNNPAWCFYDLLIESRYGLGDWIDASMVDKWNLYEIAQYCDEMVDSGKTDDDGNTLYEPRFTLNCYIQTQEEALKVVQMLASNFRGMAYWASGAVFASQDRPMDPSYLFTPANVIEGKFSYSSTARRARHNACVVQWNDPENIYKLEPELYEMSDLILETGFRFPTARTSYGCTVRGQAMRDARWVLYTENNEAEILSFGVGIEGAQLRPGDVCAVMDPSRLGASLGGRILAVNGTTITLDREVTIGSEQSNLIITTSTGIVVEAIVNTADGTTGTITVDALSEDVSAGNVWILATESNVPELWRVLSVIMEGDGEYSVTASTYCPEKYDWIETGLILEDRRSWINADPVSSSLTAPSGLMVSEYLYKDKEDLKTGVNAQWSASTDAVTYLPSWKEGSGNWVDGASTSMCSVDIKPVNAPCTFQFSVRAQTAKGKISTAATTSASILGKTAPPSDVTNFAASLSDYILVFTWTEISDLDLSYYEIREGTTWATGAVVGTELSGAKFVTQIGATRTGIYWIKAFDTSGNESLDASTATLSIYSPVDGDVLSVPAKRALAMQWAVILAEQYRLDALASNYGISSSGYDSAVSALSAFLNAHTTPYAWTDYTGPTYLGTNGGTTMKTDLANIESQAAVLRNAVAVGGMSANIAAGATDAMLASDYVDDTTGKINWDMLQVAAQTIFSQQLYMANWDNLIPNPMSELSAPSSGWPTGAYEAVGLVTGNSYAGTKCRYVAAGTTLTLTAQVPCGEGDQFAFRAYVKSLGTIKINFNGTTAASVTSTSSSSYASIECYTTSGAPSGTTYVEFVIYGGTGGAYFDNLYARRMNDALLQVDGSVTAQKLNAVIALLGIVKSQNYSAGTSSSAPIGFKISGPAFTTAFLDGATSDDCHMEMEGNANFGGYKVATVAGKVMKSITVTASSTGSYEISGTDYKMFGSTKYATPQSTGKLALIVSGIVSRLSYAGGGYVTLRYGTGTPPSAGASVAGTYIEGSAVAFNSVVAGAQVGFTMVTSLSGLTAGETYWFDFASKCDNTNGSLQVFQGINFLAMEV